MIINLLELPPEIILLILEILLAIDPVTLLGSVPGVCRQIRALCSGVHGTFDLRGEWKFRRGYPVNWDGLTGALASAALRFPRTTGLWTFSRFPLHQSCNAGLLEVTNALLKEDASKMDNAMDGGYTPLYMACKFGHLEVARLLVENGADINRAMDGGWTPISSPRAQKGHLDVAHGCWWRTGPTSTGRWTVATPISSPRARKVT